MRSGFLIAVLTLGLLVPCQAVCALAMDAGTAVGDSATGAAHAEMPCHQAQDAPRAPDPVSPVDGPDCCRDRSDAPVLQSTSMADLVPTSPAGQPIVVPFVDADVAVSATGPRPGCPARALSPPTLHACNRPLLI